MITLIKPLDYFALLPEGYRQNSVIAGGAAVDFDKAADVDLWVLLGHLHDGDSIAKGMIAQAEIYAHLLDLGLDDQVEFHSLGRDYMSDANIEKAFTVSIPGAKPAQIMLATYDRPVELLEAFDISTHMMALTPNDATITCEYTTPSYMPPIIHLPNDRTPARLKKILARYGHDSTDENVAAIMAAKGWFLVEGVWQNRGAMLPPATGQSEIII